MATVAVHQIIPGGIEALNLFLPDGVTPVPEGSLEFTANDNGALVAITVEKGQVVVEGVGVGTATVTVSSLDNDLGLTGGTFTAASAANGDEFTVTLTAGTFTFT